MNKIDLWRKGDKITATKLNDAIQVVNDLVEAENKRLEYSNNSDSSGIQYNSVSLTENIPTWYQEITPLWNQDGETVIYDTWDGIPEINAESSGLYGRQVGVNGITAARSFTDSSTLNLYKADSEIKLGQQVVQELTIDKSGNIVKNEIVIYDSVNDIPAATINPEGDSKIYRRLSRIVEDTTNGSVESMPSPSAAWLYKSVATNDFTLSPITVNAIMSSSDSSTTTPDNPDEPQTTSGDSEPTESNEISNLVTTAGIFAKVKGIQNDGGLKITDTDTTLGLQSGIEIYAQAADSSNPDTDFTITSDSKEPKASKVTIAEFPITKKVYQYDHQLNDYKETNIDTDSKLQLVAQPIGENAWQWGFTYSGQVEVDSYKYYPSNPNDPTPIPTTISQGEGIKVTQTGNNYNIERNLFIEAADSSDNPNALQVVEDKVGDKVIYKLYAPKATYEFDPDYFTVTDNSVSLKATAIDQIVNEAVSELGVSVEVSGLVESTFKGQLVANTSGTLSLSTEVSYQT